MKFIIYSSNVDRINFFKNILSEKACLKDIEVLYVESLTDLYCYMDIFEYSLYGMILDFEDMKDFTLDYKLKFLHDNIKNLSEKVKTAVLKNKLFENKSLPYIEDDFDIRKSYTSFENLLFDINNFLFQCKFVPKYRYKLMVKNEKCYLSEYIYNSTTGIRIPIVSYKDNSLTIKVSNKYSNSFVVSLAKRLLSDETNIVNIFGYIRKISFKYCNKNFTFNDSMSTKDMLKAMVKNI